jgi:nicotinamidase-related amidase
MAPIQMQPRDGTIDLSRTAVLIIDMQRDFLLPGGFGEKLGNDVSKLTRAIQPCRNVLEAARVRNMLVIHTREVRMRVDLSVTL